MKKGHLSSPPAGERGSTAPRSLRHSAFYSCEALFLFAILIHRFAEWVISRKRQVLCPLSRRPARALSMPPTTTQTTLNSVEIIKQYPGPEQVELKVIVNIPGSWFGGTAIGA